MQPHSSVAARRPPPIGPGPVCRRVGRCPFGVLLGFWATLAGGAEPVEGDERAAALAAAPIVRVATVPEPRDEQLDAEAVRARRAALEQPPRLVVTEPSAALASARMKATSAPEAAPRREAAGVGGIPAPNDAPSAEDGSARDAAAETPGTGARADAAGTDGAPGDDLLAAANPHAAGPSRAPRAGSHEGVPAVHAAAFASGRGDTDDGSEAEADEPAATASRANGAKVATRRDDGGPREARTETLSVVVGGFLPRPAAARGGREGRAGEAPRPGLARPSGTRAGLGLPRESSDGSNESSRDWKLSSGRWGLERGGRLSMELDSGYRLSLKPRRNGLVLSVRRNF